MTSTCDKFEWTYAEKMTPQLQTTLFSLLLGVLEGLGGSLSFWLRSQ
jgi:hypothetical protein